MKFTGELKKLVESAKSKEEALRHIKTAGIEMTEDELSAVSGGTGPLGTTGPLGETGPLGSTGPLS